MRHDRDKASALTALGFGSSPPGVSVQTGLTQDACVGVDYSDIVVRDHDHDVKLDCLIEKGPNTSLEEVMVFVESKEYGKLSLQQLNGGSDAAAPISAY